MDEQAHHQMILKSTKPSGVEEWICPECGRHVLVSWPPHYKKIVLVIGDESAIHSGSKGGVNMEITKLISKQELKAKEDPRLSVWSDWMKETHFDDWWDDDE